VRRVQPYTIISAVSLHSRTRAYAPLQLILVSFVSSHVHYLRKLCVAVKFICIFMGLVWLVFHGVYFYLLSVVCSVSNGSKCPVRVRLRFRPGTGPLPRVSTQNPLLKSQHFLLQLSIWVLIVSWHNLYVKYAVWCPLSSPVLRFTIGPIVIESRWKPGHFGVIFGLISKRLNEYWSNRKSESGRWNRASICTFHV